MEWLRGTVTIIIIIALLWLGAILPESSIDNPVETTITGKYIQTDTFLLLQKEHCTFSFSDCPFEYGYVNESDYYKHEIGDKYNYTWCYAW